MKQLAIYKNISIEKDCINPQFAGLEREMLIEDISVQKMLTNKGNIWHLFTLHGKIGIKENSFLKFKITQDSLWGPFFSNLVGKKFYIPKKGAVYQIMDRIGIENTMEFISRKIPVVCNSRGLWLVHTERL